LGLKLFFQTGAGIRDAVLGMPDIGLATASEIGKQCQIYGGFS